MVLAGSHLGAYPGLLAGAAHFIEAHPSARAVARLGLREVEAGRAGASVHEVKPLYLRSSLAGEE